MLRDPDASSRRMRPRIRAGRGVSAVSLIVLAALGLLSACHRGRVAPVTAAAPPPQPPPVEAPAPSVAPEEGGEGTFALEDPFTTVAAAKLATSSDRILRGLAFHGLTRLDPSGRVEPELAVRWEMLKGGAEWVFHLRPQTAFANGRYLEARHVVASWEALISGKQARYAWLLEAVKGFDEARSGEAPHVSGLILEDGLTLRVALVRPVLDLPYRLAHPALGISAFGEDQQGVGPFEIWGIPRPQQVVVRSNPEYFRRLPHLDEIAFVRGEAAQPGRMASGALDACVLEAGEKASPGPGAKIFAHSIPRTYILGLNRSKAPFSGPRTTQAFVASLNREALRRAAAGLGGWVPATLVAALAPERGASESPGKTPPVPSGLGRVDLVVPEGDRVAELLGSRIKDAILRAGGRGVLHEVIPADVGGVLSRGDYHLFVLPFLPSSPYLLLDYEELMHWNQSIPDALTAQARALEATEDPAALPSLLAPLDESLQQGGYLVPLVSLERRLLVRRGICGLSPDPSGTLDWTRIWVSTTPGQECP